MAAWHTMPSEEVVRRLDADPARGLTSAEAARRLAKHGPNAIAESPGRSPWRILLDQFVSVMTALLVFAAVVSAFLGDAADAGAILAIVILNALLGFRQDYRAERAISALKKLTVPVVRARRDGRVAELPATELAPGDLVLLTEGNLVPADCRILESVNLMVREAALTGESESAEKTAEALSGEDLPVGDRRNMGFMGTLVASGRGAALVTETGMSTELGKVARLFQEVRREPTPLQRRLDRFGKTLALLALALVGAVFLLGLLRGGEPKLLFLTAVSLAVAAVPEGLPAVATIALALGAQRMLRRNALLRRLPSVETLGAVTVICSDKTGTITGNRMEVVLVETAEGPVDLGTSPPPALPEDARLLLAAGALCNDAPGENEGDPTESALLAGASRFGLRKPDLEGFLPRLREAPFDSARRRMTTIHRRDEALSFLPAEPSFLAFTKGAAEGLLPLSRFVRIGGRIEPMDDARRNRIAAAAEGMARQGMRVLGLACRPLDDLPPSGFPPDGMERDLVFLGLAGLIDPPRPGVRQAVRTCENAGIRPVMITGDHPLTALRIASDLGIDAKGRVLTGRDLAEWSAEELDARVDEASVFARIAPEQKLSIVTALQRRGHVVAMTGDGVNDAPALKKADIGVAMGRAGTDVAKEAADMVLLDDDFATIVAAVEEGRVLYDNLRKFLQYLLMSNFGEILVMLLAPFLGMPLPLLPLQILWINLVTDGLPALALAAEPAEKGVMRRPPLPPSEHLLGRGMAARILSGGAFLGLLALAAGYWYWREGLAQWQTLLFCALTFLQMGNVLAIRSGGESSLRSGLFANRPLLAAVALTVAMQLAVVYVPSLQGIFRTVPLAGKDLAVCAAAGLAVFLWIEMDKLRARRGTVLPG